MDVGGFDAGAEGEDRYGCEFGGNPQESQKSDRN